MAEEDREMREEGTPETQRHRIKRKEEASLISSEKMRRCESFQTKEAVAEEAEKSGGEGTEVSPWLILIIFLTKFRRKPMEKKGGTLGGAGVTPKKGKN